MDYVIFAAIFFGIFAAYLGAVATFAVCREADLGGFQKIVQVVFSWGLPLIGAVVVLHFLIHQSPDLISRKLVPWPVRKMVFGKQLRTGDNGKNGEEQSGFHCGGTGSIGD